MNRTEKDSFIGDFREKVQGAPVLYLTDFSGLDVKAMTRLRQDLRNCGAEYLVVKNRLVERAIEGLDLPDISEALSGPTGVVLGYEGIVEPAKAVSDFATAQRIVALYFEGKGSEAREKFFWKNARAAYRYVER